VLCRAIGRSLACSVGGMLLASSPALAAAHTVLLGETLWSIAAANNLTTRTGAVYNGLPEGAQLVAGRPSTSQRSRRAPRRRLRRPPSSRRVRPPPATRLGGPR
jgi:hypothetical protein